jgi:hypothetical protein
MEQLVIFTLVLFYFIRWTSDILDIVSGWFPLAEYIGYNEDPEGFCKES